MVHHLFYEHYTDSPYPMSNPKTLGKFSQNEKGGISWQELQKEEEMLVQGNSFQSKRQKGAKKKLSLKQLRLVQ